MYWSTVLIGSRLYAVNIGATNMKDESRNKERQNKQAFVKRFYKDWNKYSREYCYHQHVNGVRQFVDENDRSCLTWRSPQYIKVKGQLFDKNLLMLSLVHPSESDCEVMFNISIMINYDAYSNTAGEVRHYKCKINPTLNLHASVILSKLLITMASVIGQNKLDSTVSRTVIAIIDSIQAGKLVTSTELYQWNSSIHSIIEDN